MTDRLPANLQGLLKFCLAAEDSPAANGGVEGMSAEKAAWLHEALSNLTENMVVKLRRYLGVLLENAQTETCDSPKCLQAFSSLMDLCEDIDVANDFCKIGGMDVIQLYSQNKDDAVREADFKLCAVLFQNNPFAQTFLLEKCPALLDILIEVVNSENNVLVRLRCLSAVSSLIRDSSAVMQVFVSKKGLEAVKACFFTSDLRLKHKAAFLLACIMQESDSVSEALIAVGIVEVLCSALTAEDVDEGYHEQVLRALCILCEKKPKVVLSKVKAVPTIKQSLQQHAKEYKGREDQEEALQYCKTIQSVCSFN